MSVLLKLDNFGTSNVIEKGYINADAAANATSITLKNVQGVVVGVFLLIGKPAQENAEICRVISLAGNVVTVSALTNAHTKYTDVTVLAANKLKIYRAATPTTGQPATADYSLLSTVDIDYDNLTTRYTDDDGGVGYYYRYTYYNSQTEAETSLDNSQSVRGGGQNDYCSIRDIREEAGLVNNPYITDPYIADRRTEAQNTIDSALTGSFTVPFSSPVPGTIKRITILFAAGYILKTQYGTAAVGTNADGQAKIDEAQEMLTKIINGAPIVDNQGDTVGGTRSTRVKGWPDDTTADATKANSGGARKFRAKMKF